MKRLGDLWIILGLVAGLLIITFFLASAAGSVSAREKSYSVHSSGKQGTSALSQWLRALGLKTKSLEAAPFGPGEELDLLFVINPSPNFPYSKTEAERVRRWVEDGHTLIYAAEPDTYDQLAEVLDLSFWPEQQVISRTVPGQPLLIFPATGVVETRSQQSIRGGVDDVAYLGAPGEAQLVAKEVGQGHIFALASAFPLTNEGLAVADNSRAVLNLLRTVPLAGFVGFDEYHHGYAQGQSLLTEFYRSPWGWAVLYVLAVLLIYLLLRGQRFAHVLPSTVGNRRTMAEYVQSMAGVYRHAAQRRAILAQYVEESKRDLGRLYGLSPNLPTEEFAAKLAVTSRVEAKRIVDLWNAPSRPKLSEKDFVVLAAEIEKLKEELSGDRRRSQPARR